ncbi:magnesium-translocating P-type ATPase [Acetobacterium fimetarium]|uniref:Magnesium-transporting ATPase, P-type 1 n=1 Tax=Acetobacterium fimetarium TaxID=52691 RepID=A0ABR6WRE9_9FIRM|nr:magnesium-translocating P-type ATPase [Acetobacterium fimetarium]MBC3803184.1 magnesium-translocating P-type ATPase [Acetobacterium fimetarium]
MKKSKAMKYWSLPPADVLQNLDSSTEGLTENEAALRLNEHGENSIKTRNTAPMMLFINQFKNPIILIMIVATTISALTGEWLDSLIIISIVLASVVLSFLQEYNASNAIDELRSKLHIKSTVLRDGRQIEIPTTLLVPGDVVLLSGGCLIPADGLILESDLFHVNESTLTGEAFSVEKSPSIVSKNADLPERNNCVFMGTNVVSGSATVLVTQTGKATEFGQIAEELAKRQPETEFVRGVRRFGYLLTGIMLVLTVFVFIVNVIYQRPVIDSLLFSVALAVGITPQLLPAIINITLAKGSQTMAKEGVIVRHLTALENFGSMDILCTDKTGTLTEGSISLDNAVDVNGETSETVLRLAYLNASLQTGLINELDHAIIAHQDFDISTAQKREEIPFDFSRARLSVIIEENSEYKMIVKGALNSVLKICDQVQIDSVKQTMDTPTLDAIQQHLEDWSAQGFRVLGIAEKSVTLKKEYRVEDEQAMTFMGFLLFFDPPKDDVDETIHSLSQLGVQLRVITGDNKLVAYHTANAIGLTIRNALTGAEIMNLDDKSLTSVVETTDLFAEVDPNQKARVILALKRNNHVVGFMGDGINDAPALHDADVSISVDTAVDVAKESADFVLEEKNLDVLRRGIELGRTTFANTLKYIYMTTSANFGNMFSMAGASLFLPFLPLLPKQILLINFISDFPALMISTDSVDPEMVETPHRWDIRFIRNFMFTFGLISSVFDYLCFAVLLFGFNAQEELFQSGWFVLSILTELLMLMVARTQRPFYKSKPAPILLYSTIGAGILTVILPYLPLRNILDFITIPPLTLLALFGLAILYLITTEIAKYFFFRSRFSSKR